MIVFPFTRLICIGVLLKLIYSEYPITERTILFKVFYFFKLLHKKCFQKYYGSGEYIPGMLSMLLKFLVVNCPTLFPRTLLSYIYTRCREALAKALV